MCSPSADAGASSGACPAEPVPVPSERLDELVLLVGQMRQQRVGEQVDDHPQLVASAGVVDEANERAVELLEHLVDDPVLGLQAVDDRTEGQARPA